MADESGGDFGGGSVTWRVTSGKEKGADHGKPEDPKNDKKAKKVESKLRWEGVDEDPERLKEFHIKLKGLTAEEKVVLVTSMGEAVAALAAGATEAMLRLPIKRKTDDTGAWAPQIQVVWREHHGVTGSGT